MTKGVRVLIVSNLAIVRAGLRMLIESRDGLTVIDEAGTSVRALTITAREQPDILLLEAELGCESGLDLLPDLLAASKATHAIILTGRQDPELQQRALRLGASGLVFKGKKPEIPFKAIEKVNAGEVWFERATMANALGEMSRINGVKETDVEVNRIATLTQETTAARSPCSPWLEFPARRYSTRRLYLHAIQQTISIELVSCNA